MIRHLFFSCFFVVFCCTTFAQQAKFDSVQVLHPGSLFDYVGTGDINGDGLTDVVGGADRIFLWLQGSNGQLQPVSVFSYGVQNTADCIGVCDLFKDGTAEVLFGIGGHLNIYSWVNNGLVLTDSLILSQNNLDDITTGDFDGDSLTDIGVTYTGQANKVTVIYQNGESNSKWDIHHYSMPTFGYNDVEAGKFGPLQQTALIHINGYGVTNPLTILTFDSNRALLNKYDLTVPGVIPNPHAAAIVRKGAGKPNELWVSFGGNTPNSRVAIWRGLQAVSDSIFQVGNIPEAMHAANLDCDDDDEVVILHGGWMSATVLADNAKMYKIPYTSHYAQDGLALGDINNDGRIDICIADWPEHMELLYNITSPCWPADVPHPETASKELSIYPNPSSDRVTVSYAGTGKLLVCDVQGRAVYSAPFDQQAAVDISQWTPGMYFVKLYANDGQVFSKKLLKE